MWPSYHRLLFFTWSNPSGCALWERREKSDAMAQFSHSIRETIMASDRPLEPSLALADLLGLIKNIQIASNPINAQIESGTGGGNLPI